MLWLENHSFVCCISMHGKQLIVDCLLILFVVSLVFEVITHGFMNRHVIVYIQDSGHLYTKNLGPELVLGLQNDDRVDCMQIELFLVIS